MNFVNRFLGIFFNPGQTLKALTRKPLWVDSLILLLIVIAVFTYLTLPYSQKDQLQMVRDNVKLQERMGKEGFERYVERLENPSKSSVILQSFLLVPLTNLFGFLFSSLIILAMGRFASTEGKYLQVFSAYLHANFIDKILGNSLRLVLILTRKSAMQTTTGAALFFPKLEITSPAFIVLSQVDFFQLWLFGIFALGLASIFKIELKKALFVSYGFWLLKSLVYIGLGFISLRFM